MRYSFLYQIQFSQNRFRRIEPPGQNMWITDKEAVETDLNIQKSSTIFLSNDIKLHQKFRGISTRIFSSDYYQQDKWLICKLGAKSLLDLFMLLSGNKSIYRPKTLELFCKQELSIGNQPAKVRKPSIFLNITKSNWIKALP